MSATKYVQGYYLKDQDHIELKLFQGGIFSVGRIVNEKNEDDKG